MGIAEQIIEVARIGPEDKLVIHLSDADDESLFDDIVAALGSMGLQGRVLVLYGDMTLKVIAPS